MARTFHTAMLHHRATCIALDVYWYTFAAVCERNQCIVCAHSCEPVRQDPVLGTTITQISSARLNSSVAYDLKRTNECTSGRSLQDQKHIRNTFAYGTPFDTAPFWWWWLPGRHSVSSTDIFPRKKTRRLLLLVKRVHAYAFSKRIFTTLHW